MPHYLTLESPADFEAALEESRHRRIAILKHSTSCPISLLAKGRVDSALKSDSLGVPVYYLDLLRYRQVSNQIASDLGVRHESPQLIVVDDARAVHVSSHLQIDPSAIRATAH